MGKIKSIICIALLFLPLVFFQNCVGKNFDPESAPATKATESDSTGQPYDGKVYIVAGSVCADGTFVQSRILLHSKVSATVVRENCQDVSRDLGAGEFSVDSASAELSYRNQTFTLEQPVLQIPVFAPWYYQLTGTIQSTNALVYIIDLFETSASQIQSLKQAGHIVICNFSSGTFENWRPDASSFQIGDLGNNVTGGPGERWLDTRSASVRTIMKARLDLAKSKTCDGVDLDSADGFSNNSGFPLTRSTQIEYNQALAFAAHDRNLLVALKNNPDLVSSLVHAYDLAISEQCFQFNECAKFQPFTEQGKPVLAAEYQSFSNGLCSAARSLSMSLSFFSQDLDGSQYQSCP